MKSFAKTPFRRAAMLTLSRSNGGFWQIPSRMSSRRHLERISNAPRRQKVRSHGSFTPPGIFLRAFSFQRGKFSVAPRSSPFGIPRGVALDGARWYRITEVVEFVTIARERQRLRVFRFARPEKAFLASDLPKPVSRLPLFILFF